MSELAWGERYAEIRKSILAPHGYDYGDSGEAEMDAKRLLELVDERYGVPYDKDFGDDKLCVCGHSYYRHFDTYDEMLPVGCKYCGDRFKEAS